MRNNDTVTITKEMYGELLEYKRNCIVYESALINAYNSGGVYLDFREVTSTLAKKLNTTKSGIKNYLCEQHLIETDNQGNWKSLTPDVLITKKGHKIEISAKLFKVISNRFNHYIDETSVLNYACMINSSVDNNYLLNNNSFLTIE